MLHVMSEAPPDEYEFLSNPWVPPHDDERAADIVDAVLAYVISDLGGGVTMSEAANRVGMSESALSRYFSRAVGQTFSDTVRKLRLAQACQLLEHTGDSVATVSLRCGYRNLSNFNRQFRREYGKTPTEYRSDYRLERR
jgi:AraC-like DNA-binding protein